LKCTHKAYKTTMNYIIFLKIFVALHLFWNMIAVISLSILPYIPDIVFINELLHRLFQNFMPVYYVNKKKYLYLLVLHTNAVYLIGGTAFVATGMMLISYVKHACGMFRIAR